MRDLRESILDDEHITVDAAADKATLYSQIQKLHDAVDHATDYLEYIMFDRGYKYNYEVSLNDLKNFNISYFSDLFKALQDVGLMPKRGYIVSIDRDGIGYTAANLHVDYKGKQLIRFNIFNDHAAKSDKGWVTIQYNNLDNKQYRKVANQLKGFDKHIQYKEYITTKGKSAQLIITKR